MEVARRVIKGDGAVTWCLNKSSTLLTLKLTDK